MDFFFQNPDFWVVRVVDFSGSELKNFDQFGLEIPNERSPSARERLGERSRALARAQYIFLKISSTMTLNRSLNTQEIDQIPFYMQNTKKKTFFVIFFKKIFFFQIFFFQKFFFWKKIYSKKISVAKWKGKIFFFKSPKFFFFSSKMYKIQLFCHKKVFLKFLHSPKQQKHLIILCARASGALVWDL